MYYAFLIIPCVIVVTLQNTATVADDNHVENSSSVDLERNINPQTENFRNSVSNVVRYHTTSQEHHKREKRDILDSESCVELRSCNGRCSKRRQFHNIPENRSSPACYCDPECETVFSDCCADYETNCKVKRKRKKPASHIDDRWHCVSEFKEFPYGIWVVGECHPTWPEEDEVAMRCTGESETQPKASDLIPVFDKKYTFRNIYCAVCNKIEDYVAWKHSIKCTKSPLRKYGLVEKMEHLDEYCDAKTLSFKRETRNVRYCYDVREHCKYEYHRSKCYEGSAALVSHNKITYKNYDCLLCSYKEGKKPDAYCGPLYVIEDVKYHDEVKHSPFSEIFEEKEYTEEIAYSPPIVFEVPKCSSDQIYDISAGYCRDVLVLDQSRSLLKRLATRLQYQQLTNTCFENDTALSEQQKQEFLFRDFQMAMGKMFYMKGWYLSDFSIYPLQDNRYSVTFQLLSARNNDTGSHLEDLEIEQLDVRSNTGGSGYCNYTLLESVIRDMSCVGNKTYRIRENVLAFFNESIFINDTQTSYSYGEYVLYEYQNDTMVAVCNNFLPAANCSRYLDIENTSSWYIFPNRSLYSEVASSWYNYGDYSLINGTLWLCLTEHFMLKESRTFYNVTNQTRVIQQRQKTIHDHILSYLSLVTLCISIISLLALLIVYSIFPPLRNLPGKNLMLLCSTLALSELLWLLRPHAYSWSPSLCIATKIALQYFFLATFCCSGSIAFHSFSRFRALSNGNLWRRSNEKAFLWSVLYGLGFPVLLVASFWLLDFHEVLNIGYGTGEGYCWFLNKSGLNIAFIYPLFSLLFINFVFLFATVRVIYKCTKASRKVAQNNGGPNRTHVWIYLRMSVMMGLTWLLGVFIIFFPENLFVHYLFNLVNGLQGLYLAVAFLFTDNVRKLISKNKEIQRNTTTRQTTSI